MKIDRIVGMSLASELLVSAVFAAETVRSGPQVDEDVP